jgi:hypothetical protein
MRTKLKLVLVLASLGALAALAMSSTASAGAGPATIADPMEANIPYVAWAGEELRLVKCVSDEEGDWLGTSAEWAIVDSSVRQRSGDLRDPVFFDDADRRTGAFAGAGEQDGATCWAIDVDSVNPGMTRIKMAVDGNEGTPGSPTLKHDFLVIWLNMSAPVLTELSDAAFPGYAVGDPLGDGNFSPIGTPGDFKNGLIRARVTGSFMDLHGAARTLPADWASLAGRYAFDTSGYNTMAWDIHDDDLATEGHTATSVCGGVAAIDAVDNCLGGNEVGRFSRSIGGTFPFTLGPFDPARPDTSFLPDGKLDAGDAPMPAARIDVSLTGTVGALAAADKHVLYSRNRTGVGSTAFPGNAHNLYAPFYVSNIPGDASQELGPGGYTTSGTTGPIANNFPGYQSEFNPIVGARAYHFWDLLNVTRRGGLNACRDVGGTGQVGPGVFIPRPTGIDSATVYTDEHGEAILQFDPDVGVTLVPDSNGRCDLGEVGPAALLGSASISAEALDPFQLTFNDPRLSNTLTKNVFELAGKSLDCVPKSANEAFCVEVIRDIRGNPVVGAEVSFTREPRGLIIPASIILGGYNTVGQTIVSATADEVRVRTNALGQVGVEIKSTLPGLVDLDAENVGTRNGGFGVQRVRCLRFAGNGTTLPTDGPTCVSPTDGGTPIPTPGTPPAPGGGSSGSSGSSQSTATTATVVSLAGNPVPAAIAPAAKPAAKAAALKLTSARLVFKNGKRYLVVRVNGAAKSAKVRITLVMRTGKATKPVVRTIRTNAAVRVANLQVSKHVRTVRVSLAR